MKTAISVPDGVFERVERRVSALGVSRSEFFSVAAEHYLRLLDEQDITAYVDAAIERAGESAAAEQRALAQIGLASLEAVGDDEW